MGKKEECHRRKYLRSLVTKLNNDIPNFPQLSVLDRQSRLLKIQAAQEDLKVVDSAIRKFLYSDETIDDAELEREMAECEAYQDKLRDVLCALKDPQVSVSQPDTGGAVRSMLRSPTAPLPTFTSAEGENLELFLVNFEETILQFKYAEYDKFLLLKQQITGKASYLIDSLEPNKQTYLEAKALLLKAFATTSLQKFNTLKQLSEMKLSYNDEPFKFMGNMRKIQQAVIQLNITTDDVLQYFFLRGMNETFISQLTQITNNIRPTLNEINDHFFAASERYSIALKLKGKSSNSEQTNTSNKGGNTSYAVAIDGRATSNPFKKCPLCVSDSDHRINKCKNYPKAVDKIKRLLDIDGCVKCGNFDHNSLKCKFRFKKKCNICSKWHFTFLCPDFCTIDTKSTSNKPAKTQNNIVVINTFSNTGRLENVLPTLSVDVGNVPNIRCLLDSGSQNNLVAKKILTPDNHEILEQMDLNIQGVNSVEFYKSQIVRLKVSMGRKWIFVDALVMPEITLSLELPGLSDLASAFARKGYALADNRLIEANTIDGVDLMIGIDSFPLFFDSIVRFGANDSSAYFNNSEMGIMLTGNVQRMLANFSYLEDCTTTCSRNLANITHSCGSQTTVACPSICTDEDCSPLDFQDHSDLLSDDRLERECNAILHKVPDIDDHDESELNNNLINYALSNTKRSDDGRLIMPLLWNGNVKSRLASNFNLAKRVLTSNKKKLLKDNTLEMVHSAIKEWEDLGVIKPIVDYEQFARENPSHNFLAHMPVFRMNKETTKCRVVFLSNLCAKDKHNLHPLSHNQAMHSGPCLNQKLTVALLLLRFDEKLLCFDIKKAFLQIALYVEDTNKLLFFWFNDPLNEDFSLKVYKNVRLSFGLRCSPTILMLGLYKILIEDASGDSDRLQSLKKLIYELIYMDNGAVSMNSSQELLWAFEQLSKIFGPYKFELQQYCTNDPILENEINKTSGEPMRDTSTELFGLLWDTKSDTLSPKPKMLCSDANTKRKVLQTIAEVFDPFNFVGPLLNRARLFMHKLQLDKEVNWDTVLSSEICNEWTNICKQFNTAPFPSLQRFVGRRNGTFQLIAFVDSSKLIYGVVLYLLNVETKELHFLLAKNRMIGRNLEGKSIPSLELLSISLGVETLIDIKIALTGVHCYNPINISDLLLFSDSLVALSWVHSNFVKLAKMNKLSVFVMNRLNAIGKLCESAPVNFNFIDGINNPADCITRPLSYNLLARSNYLSGPSYSSISTDSMVGSAIPNFSVPVGVGEANTCQNSASSLVAGSKLCSDGIFDCLRFSTLPKLLRVCAKVLIFIDKLKLKTRKITTLKNESEYQLIAHSHLLEYEQQRHYKDIFCFLDRHNQTNVEMPNVMKQLNVFADKSGILRVGSKMVKRTKFKSDAHCPILLPKDSHFTTLIIRDLHAKLRHSGLYSCLSLLRKTYWIPCHFSTVRKVLRACVHCKRFNERTVKLNQSPYRDFRMDPKNVPYSNIFIDYLGPFKVFKNSQKVKVYILCVTCLWTRAINLKISLDLSTSEFIRSFHLHTLEYGMPSLVLSDLGTQLVAGGNLIRDILTSPETSTYLGQYNTTVTEFQQYYKGCNELGSLVESCVKICKRLIFGSIRNNVLEFRKFEFLICEVVNLANKRPIGFKESLRDNSIGELPPVITPELLLHGYELINVNITPHSEITDPDPNWNPTPNENTHSVRMGYQQLERVRHKLHELYNEHFIPNLIDQAVNSSDRYRKVKHNRLNVGDIVLLKESHTKPSQYPMGLVKELQVNDLGETTGATVFKGLTRELVKRHASVLIPILACEDSNKPPSSTDRASSAPSSTRRRRRRQAAEVSEERTRHILSSQV